MYVDDFGYRSRPKEATQEEMDAMNQRLVDRGLEEYGWWYPYQPGFFCPEENMEEII